MGVNWASIVCPFLLPLSFLWDLISLWQLKFRFWRCQGPATHKDRVRKVQEQVREWRVSGRGRKMCTARPSWMSISQQKLGYKDRMYRVNVDLPDILEISETDMTVTVEPAVTIGFLNIVLVNSGFTLPIVPELDTLTIGGLIMGGGIESTSHKYGLFHKLSVEYEIVTADGECVIATEEENSDLFKAVPMSYGTLGFLASVKLRIIKYKPFIKLDYFPTYSLDETTDVLDRETRRGQGNDSVEGIAFTKDKAVIMTGTFVEEHEVESNKINNMGLWYKPWFYHYVEGFLQKGPSTEYVPTLAFHQRHNKPTFWLSHIWVPWASNPIARLLTGWILPMNQQILQLVKETFLGGDFEDNFVLQDFILPIKHIKAAVEFNHTVTGIYPLWMVPAQLDTAQEDTIFVDLGVYGFSTIPSFAGRDQTLRLFERFTLEHRGYQALYAETLMSREEFLEMFAEYGQQYEQVRKRIPYCEEAFPETYEKVSRKGREATKKENNRKET